MILSAHLSLHESGLARMNASEISCSKAKLSKKPSKCWLSGKYRLGVAKTHVHLGSTVLPCSIGVFSLLLTIVHL